MKRNTKWTVLAVAIAAATSMNAGAFNRGGEGGGRGSDVDVDIDVTADYDTNVTIDKNVDIDYSDSFDRNTVINNTSNNTSNNTVDNTFESSVDLSLTKDISYSDSFDRDTTIVHDVDTSYSSDESHSVETSFTSSQDHSATTSFDASTTIEKSYSDTFERNTSLNYERNLVDNDINHDEDVNVDHDITINKEVDEHGVSAELESDLSLTSDIDFTGNPTVSGDLEIDSAAIAVIDNRQGNSGNIGLNDRLTNDATISENTAANAEGNLQFNVVAGDNNQQDNAAALSAADASFAFGLADSKVLVQQVGTGNLTSNLGVANTASVSDNAFANAVGNIGVNVTSGNNNQQKNSLAASVATSRYASAAVSAHQVSAGNAVSNAPKTTVESETLRIGLTGWVSGYSEAIGVGEYEGSSTGSYRGTGYEVQANNLYADAWTGERHTSGNNDGHIDFDGAAQGAAQNPNRPGVGGFSFDTTESGRTQSEEEGDLAFYELGYSELYASLSGTLQIYRNVVDSEATNTALLSGDAFNSAAGNIGVNVSAGTGNQQANSLSLAVAQPSTSGTE